MLKTKFILPILIIFIVAGLSLGFYYFEFLPKNTPGIPKNEDFYSSLDTIEIASSEQARITGLMNRKELCQKCGMLFEFETEEKQSFWMENTLISLDMIFMDKTGKIVTIHKSTKPLQQFPTYDSKFPAKYVLEVNAGFSDKNNLTENQSLDIAKLKIKGVVI